MKTMPFIIGLLLCLHATPALAIPETWVASNGGGAACTRAAPCLTFAAAHTATDSGGTIKCVDAADFGVLTITKSITIDCTGTNGGIVATAGNAIGGAFFVAGLYWASSPRSRRRPATRSLRSSR